MKRLIRIFKQIAKKPSINYFLRLVLPPFLRHKFPAYGLLSVGLSRGKSLKIVTDPKDALGTILYRKGLKRYEPEVLPLLRRLLPGSKVFLDVGAHTGLYALIAAAENPELAVYAFEPVPDIFTYFERNIETNRFRKIFAYQKALTNFDGQMSLYVPVSEGIPMVASGNKNFRKNTQEVPVKAVRLDSFVERHGISKVDLMKIDTESTEADVLEGAQETVARDRPVIFCEVLAHTPTDRLNRFFENKDYGYCLLTEEGLVPKSRIENHPKFWNYLFIPVERWEEITARCENSLTCHIKGECDEKGIGFVDIVGCLGKRRPGRLGAVGNS